MYFTFTSYSEFLSTCNRTNDLTAKLMSGIEKNLPELYKAMPKVDYDFNTVAQLVNVVCTDDKSTLDTLMMYAFKDAPFTKEDHIYWTTLLMQSCGLQLSDKNTKLLAFLWMFDYLASERDTKEGPNSMTEYLAGFEKYLEGGEN